MKRAAAFIIAALSSAQITSAAPAHVLRLAAPAPGGTCSAVSWKDVLTFYNTTAQPLTVRILGISNGGTIHTDPDAITVPAGAAVSADAVLGDAWRPQNGSNLWIMHLDAPIGIIAESRNEILVADMCSGVLPPASVTRSADKSSLPIFQTAAPANASQVYLGTDAGSKEARINVGIYNQSSLPANAHIEIRRECDNSLADSRDVIVPPDTMMQFTGFAKGANTCAPSGTTPNWLRYTVITVDQPSMTYAIALSDTRDALTTPEVVVPSNVRY